jgi:two-component system, cell cycle sensor histidine kinase and response regulator CckA
MTGPQRLRVLLVEDSEDDAQLLTRELKRVGYDAACERVDTADAMRSALETRDWDLVIADYNMPNFSAPAALALLQATGLDLPFIIVSGSVGEEVVVEAMKAGARDYLPKGNLKRLIPAVRRELEQAGERRARKIAEEQYRELVASAPIGIYRATKEGRLDSANLALARLIGYESSDELLGLNVQQDVYFELADRTKLLAELERVGSVSNFEVRFKRKDGTPIWVRVDARGVRDSSGAVERLEGFVHDITERKFAEEALEQSKERLRLVLDTAHEAFIAMDAQGRIVDWNPQAAATFGWTPEEAIGRILAETIIPERHREAHARGLAHFLQTGQGPVLNRWFEITALDRGGREFPVELMISPMRFGEGYLFNAFLHDVSERKAAEEALRASEERYRLLFERNLAGVFRSTLEGQLLDCNDAFARIYGYASRREILARPASDLYSAAELRNQLMERIRLEGELINYEEQGRRKDGGSVWVLGNYTLVPHAKGDEGILEGTIVDITERRSLEEQLRQSQKMEAIGQLAGGVAHDFNNLLTAILGYADLLTGRVEGQDMEAVAEIIKAGERAASLTRQLLAFSRKQVLAPEVLDVNRLIENLEKMLRRLIGEHIELVTRLAPTLGRVRADAGQIEQVILNLVVNGRDAMPRGGRLVIETAGVELDDAYAREHVSVRPGRYVMIAVSDSGLGMDAATKSRIFEPFFTTKPTGTGLGLATVYGIVKQSGGNIWVYSELGRGTTFKIYLPKLEGAEEVVAPKKEPVSVPAVGAETILLVEDEEAVRSLTRRVLEKHGYAVLVAKSGAEALEIARSHTSPVHLLLSDLVMPGMGGPELAAQLVALRRGIRVLFMSGYTDDAVIRDGLINQTTSFLQKPFTPDGLVRKVRETLS